MKGKEVIKALLNGAYIARRINRRKGFGYALYKDKMVLVASVSDLQFRSLEYLFKEKRSHFTLNLNLVRQEHGNSLAKTLYKESKKKSNAAS